MHVSLLVVLEVYHDQITSSGYQTNFHSSPHYNLPLRASIEDFRIRIPTVIKVTICFRTFSEGRAYFLADLPTYTQRTDSSSSYFLLNKNSIPSLRFLGIIQNISSFRVSIIVYKNSSISIETVLESAIFHAKLKW